MKIRRNNKVSKKFVGIAKVDYDTSTKQPICVKYRFNDIDKFILFVKNKFPSVCWINIYCNLGIYKDRLLYTWGAKKGLQQSY